jgi:multiple sugar transport system ATP-binding protein
VRDALLKRAARSCSASGPTPSAQRSDGVEAQVAVNQWLGDQTHVAADFAGGTMVLVEHDRTSLQIGETSASISIRPACMSSTPKPA